MRRFDLLDDLSTVATPRRPWPSRRAAGPKRPTNAGHAAPGLVRLTPLALVALGAAFLALS